MASKQLSRSEEKKGTAKAAVRIRATDIFRFVYKSEFPFDKVMEFRKEIRDLAKKHPQVLLDVATAAISETIELPKIQTYVLASEVLIKAGKKLEPEVKAATFQSLLQIIENPQVVKKESLVSMNPDYLRTIFEGMVSLELKASDRRFLNIISSFGYGNRPNVVHSLEALANNPSYTGKYKDVPKYAKKLARMLK